MSSAVATQVLRRRPSQRRTVLSDEGRRLLFTEARTNQYYLPTEVSDDKLKEMYELWKFGPTSANTNPARVIFVKTAESKEKLQSALMESNRPKVATAPVTAIIALDEKFYDHLPRLAPPLGFYKDVLAGAPEMAKGMSEQSSALQAAYFILAARAVGLDAGPMGGFDRATLDKLFFEGHPVRGTWKSQVIVNLGYADISKLHPRFPRFEFDEVNAFV